jgi:cytochrome c-type biogenesis protein
VILLAVTVHSLSPGAVLLAFAAGSVSFVSPCVLPLVPVYLSYISGVGVERLAGERDRVLAVALAFVTGFSTVFVLLGAAFGGVGGLLLQYRHGFVLVAGVFLIVSGLVVAGALRLPGPHLAVTPRAGGLARAFVTGAAVSIGWTPCVGYVLGGILMLAGTRQSAPSGALLLLVYSAGLGVPFVLAALAFGWMTRRLAALRRHYRVVQMVAGGLLAVSGVLLVTGLFDQLSRRLPGASLFNL